MGKQQHAIDPASTAVLSRLRELVAELERQAPLVRDDLPDSIHDMRVATRRLRSLLATFRPLLGREVTEPLRTELKWIAGLLGDARDTEVMRHLLIQQVLREQGSLVIGPVLARIGATLGAAYRTERAAALEAMESTRYRELVESLNALAENPPWTDLASEPADDVLRRRVRHDWKRVSRAVSAPSHAGAPQERNAGLHEVRKAAKRARYAGEVLVPLYGRKATRFVKSTKRIQSVLGDQHDAVVAQGLLRELAVAAHDAGESDFTYGRVHAHADHEASQLERRFESAVWPKASRKKLRRWLE